MNEIPTPRGAVRLDFIDLLGVSCSLQGSSLTPDDAIWLGCDTGTHVGGVCLARMHLNREQVAVLLPYLQRFVETGLLTAPTPSAE